MQINVPRAIFLVFVILTLCCISIDSKYDKICHDVRIDVVGGNPKKKDPTYGQWPIILGCLDSNSIIFSYGLGGDISFENSLIAKFHCHIYGFDPIVDQKQIDVMVNDQKYFHFRKNGIGIIDGNISFYKSLDKRIHSLSSSYYIGYNPIPVFSLPVERLETSMSKISPKVSWIDVLKLDVEGVELDYFLSIPIDSCFPVTQILVEFHDRFNKTANMRTHRREKIYIL